MDTVLRPRGAGLGLAWALAVSAALGVAPAGALDPERQLDQYGLAVWSAVDGLPQNAITAITESDDGFLWLGTQEGLARFDGVEFRLYDRRNVAAFADPFVTALLAAPDGVLWIGTREGLLRHAGGLFERVPGLPEEYVRSLYRDRGGALWIGTYGGGLARLAGDRMEHLGAAHGLEDLFVRAVHEDRSGRTWVGTSAGLHRLDGERFTVFGEAEGLGDEVVRALAEDADGVLWVGTDEGGLARLAGERFVAVDLPVRSSIRALHVDRGGALWIGTNGGGLVRYRHGETAVLSAADGLPSGVVWSLLEDREGSLWVGSRAGLVQLKDQDVTAFTARHGLADEFARAVLEDRAGTVWVGTGSGLYAHRDGRFGVALPGVAVRALLEGAGGALWIGTRRGVVRLEDGRARRFGEAQGLPPDEVNALVETPDGALWVGTGGGGLYRRQGDRFVSIGAPELSGARIRTLLVGREGGLWIGTEGGLLRLEGDAVRRHGAAGGLDAAFVLSLWEDRDGVLWVGTTRGLSWLAAGVVHTADVGDGLVSDTVFHILEDHAEQLWLSSNRGVFRLAKRDLAALADGRLERLRPEWFTESDGMPSRECNGGTQTAGWRSRDGRLWFPTIQGLAVIDPRAVRREVEAPTVLVERVLADSREVAAAGAITLAPGTESLQLDYTAPSFIAPEQMRFRYRLVGLADEWVEAGTRRTAFYTRLPPGDYRFEVAAARDAGVWSQRPASVDLRLEPYFYQTSWFVPLVVAVTAALVLGAVWYRLERLERSRRELERLVAERTGQLERANLALEELASIDSLTGVTNHRRFVEALEDEWRRARRGARPVSLVLVDIDHFKRYNDTYGHQAGDDCLRRVARCLEALARRSGDLFARYGGEEFVALLPETPAAQAAQVGESFRAAVAALAIEHRAAELGRVSISVGVATRVPAGESGSEGLFAAADEALYRAKAAGRDRVEAATEGVPA